MANQYTSEYEIERLISVRLLSRGLVTVAELANYFGLARQTVAVWARDIDVAGARCAAITKAVRRASPRK